MIGNKVLTVITVVRNDRLGLRKTIESIRAVRAVSSTAFDYIVVDGASTDGTRELLVEYASDIFCSVSEPDKGIYDAMNKGAKLANVESFLLWINAGDSLLNIDKLSELFTQSNIDAIFAGVQLPNGTALSPKIKVPYDAKNFFPASTFRHQGFAVGAKKFHELGGYDLTVGIQAELLLMSRAIRHANWIVEPTPIAEFMLDGVSNTKYWPSLKSYLNVASRLDIRPSEILRHHFLFLTKTLIKISLPRAIVANILKRRWGS